MSGIFSEGSSKIKRKLQSIYSGGPLDIVLRLIESKTRIDSTILFLALVLVLGVYLIFGWCNDFVCNVIGFIYGMNNSLMVIYLSDTTNHTRILAYWMIYSSLHLLEYILHGFFNFLRTYWLWKCFFLIWFYRSKSTLTEEKSDSASSPFIIMDNSEIIIPDSTIEQQTESNVLPDAGVEEMEFKTSSDPKVDLEKFLSENADSKALNLSIRWLNDDCMPLVVHEIRNNTALTELDLGANPIGEKGMKELCDVLRENTTLTTLGLAGITMTTETIQYLSAILANNTSITDLTLEHNGLKPEDAKYLADALQTNSTITKLRNELNDLDDEGTRYLFTGLKYNKGLRELSVIRNGIGNKGARYIGEYLQCNSTLTTLLTTSNSIGSDGIKKIADGLRLNTTLEVFNVDYNKIEEDGFQYLFESLQNNTTLKTIDLTRNVIDEDAKERFVQAFKAIPQLELSI